MGAKLSFKYDRDADILHIDKRPPYPEQESEELGDEVTARLNPDTGEVENLEVLFFSTRLFAQRSLRIAGIGGAAHCHWRLSSASYVSDRGPSLSVRF